jgi:hypothetical protein
MATQSLLKFGIETGFDTVGNILGDLVSGNPITFESVMTSTLQGIGMSLAMSKVGKIKAVEATQTKFTDIGAGFGTSVGNKIKTGFSGGIDTPTATPHVDTPNVKQPEVEVKTPATEVKAPETEVKTPATEVKAPETEAPNRGSTSIDEPEPGVVAKQQTADGKELTITEDGKVIRCTGQCEIISNTAKPEDITGANLAKQKGLPDAPEGYHWANQNGEPILKRNPQQAQQLPELKANPKNPQELIPVANPPEGYQWVSQGDGKFTLKAQSTDFPAIEYNPKTGGFVDTTTGKPYVPASAKGSWGEHQWGNSSVAPCFPPGTIVKTPNGDRQIEDLTIGDLVIAYDFESKTPLIQPILHLYKNWTENLVDVNIDGELITSTRLHPFWVESSSKWLSASQLESGMTLKTITDNSITIDFAKTYAYQSATYNLEVCQAHNYFVGTTGVLVHNGDESSNFADTTKKSAKIYEIIDSSSGKDVVVYRGKTVQDTVEQRFKQHLSDDAAKKADWSTKFKERELRIRPIAGGNWTDYETAVWEQHFIDDAVAKGHPIVNDLTSPPISENRYNQYKHLHSPCP